MTLLTKICARFACLRTTSLILCALTAMLRRRERLLIVSGALSRLASPTLRTVNMIKYVRR